mmetsp:Transcript_47181/g.64243  ORF Transcript_47181/g.64243 Transcript_47181/m.64243 type:complete len:202 (-) Transcript_47181:426-1031(-)
MNRSPVFLNTPEVHVHRHSVPGSEWPDTVFHWTRTDDNIAAAKLWIHLGPRYQVPVQEFPTGTRILIVDEHDSKTETLPRMVVPAHPVCGRTMVHQKVCLFEASLHDFCTLPGRRRRNTIPLSFRFHCMLCREFREAGAEGNIGDAYGTRDFGPGDGSKFPEMAGQSEMGLARGGHDARLTEADRSSPHRTPASNKTVMRD